MYCKFCGAKITDDAIYCTKCGKTVKESSNNSEDTSEKTLMHVSKKNNKFKLIIILVVTAITIVMIFACMAAYHSAYGQTANIYQGAINDILNQ